MTPEIRGLARDMTQARDDQILRIVAMVDALPERGEADLVLAPLRPRLARLRPPRPLRFARLLFLPLDPLIVAPTRWRSGHSTIPRTAIPVLAAAVEAGLGSVARAAGAMIEGRTTRDLALIEEAGGLLWQAAGQVLRDAEAPPPGWERTGLAPHLHRPLARRIGALLSQASRLLRLEADAAQGLAPPEVNALRALLTDAIAFEPDAQSMLIALLLARVPEAGSVLAGAARTLGHRGEMLLRHAGEEAANVLLDQLEAPGATETRLGGQDLSDSGAAVRRLTALLGALDGASVPPARRERLAALRLRLRVGCQALFEEHMSVDLLEPLRAGGPDEAWALEATARGLRALETEARRMGGGAVYDSLLCEAAAAVRDCSAQGGLGRAGALRLTEILAGPEAALALLEGELEAFA